MQQGHPGGRCAYMTWGGVSLHTIIPTGESNTVVSPTVPGGLSDGQWHRVHLRYYNKVGVPSAWAWGSRAARSCPAGVPRVLLSGMLGL